MRTEFASEREKKNYFNKMTEAQKIEAFSDMLAASSHAVFLGGDCVIIMMQPRNAHKMGLRAA